MKRLIPAVLLVFASISFAQNQVTEPKPAAQSVKIITNIKNAKQVNAIKSNIASLLDGLKIEQINTTEYANLFEIITPRGVFYTDEKGSFVIFSANIIDTNTKQNLTAKRFEEVSPFEFDKLPFDDAIKTVIGDGSRRIASFEDPNCGYCKKLRQELAKLDNVTIYTWIIPILSDDSRTKAKQIWCAPDRQKVWIDYMSANAPLPEATDCENPIDKNLSLSQKLHIMATPAILFTSNEKSPGFMTAQDIEAKFASIPH